MRRGNLFYQDVFYNPRVGINIFPKSLVLEAFTDEPLSFSQKHLQWISGQIVGGFRIEPFALKIMRLL
jgi:hypothetical protein